MASKGRELGNIVSPKTGIAVTFSGDPVILGVGNTEHVRVTGGGKIGIGKSDPNTLIHVHGTSSSQKLITLSSSTLRNNYIGVNGSDNLEIGADEDDEGNDSSIRFRVDGSERLRVTSAGLVGIGTNNPGTKLDVQGGNWTNGDIVVGQLGNAGKILFRRGADGSAAAYLGYDGATNNNQVALAVNTGDGTILFKTNSTERLRVTSDGNIGIGTDSVGNISGRSQVVIGGDSGGLLDFNVGGTTEARLFATDATGLTIRASESDGGIVFQTAGSNERLRITSNGDVGIGNISPSCKLSIKDTAEHTAYNNVTPSVGSCMMQLYNNPPNETANDHATIQLGVNGGSYNRVCTISAVAQSATNRYAYLAFCTDDAGGRSEKLRIQASGGISFNGDTAAANALDDYEEGTWTPTVSQGVTGTPGYANQLGWYTKIGRVVYCHFYLRFSASGNTGSGAHFYLAGLPYNSPPTGEGTYSSRGMGVSNYHSIPGFDSSNISFYGITNNSVSCWQGKNSVTTSSAVNSTYIIGGFQYIAD
jgi:hypothetical protein